jgi:hypothetical protein
MKWGFLNTEEGPRERTRPSSVRQMTDTCKHEDEMFLDNLNWTETGFVSFFLSAMAVRRAEIC